MLSAWRGIRDSRLLRLIAALVLLERLVPDISNYLYTVEITRAFAQRDALAAALATFSQWTNLASFVAGLTVSTWLLRAARLEWSLITSPVPNAVGLALYAFAPGLAVAIGLNGVEGTFRYTVFKSAKETAYTAAPKDLLYPVKALVEMFLYRFARGLAGFLLILLTSERCLGLGSGGVALAGVPLAVLWVWVGWRLGGEFERRDSPENQRKLAAA